MSIWLLRKKFVASLVTLRSTAMRSWITAVVALVVTLSSDAQAQVWERVSLPGQFAQGYYLDVFFLPTNPQYGWACGYQGYVLRTTDSGRSWQGSIVPYNGRAGGHLESVHFVDALNGYTSGPAGVFRTTDGGVTWTDVTPAFPNEASWGCYFLTATTGVVVGGGCIGSQNFFRTTNGGQSWTLFQSNQLGSGLTDAILYPSGEGYAVSSGLLWQTTDGGQSWSVLGTTGPAYWNEELAKSGASFLIPWAGNTCSGQGPGGGGRFSTDGGQNWRSFSTGTPMFGAWLHDSQRGWICGFVRSVWYTSDAGQNWHYRGCGTEGDLDDIWMINDTTGFVVGQGIYRYAPAKRTTSKQSIDFGSHCLPVLRFDTLYLRNRSWNSAMVRLSSTGQHASAFAIVQPSAQPAAIASCDSLMVIVRYQPSAEGVHTATLRVEFLQPADTLFIPLSGERIDKGIVPQDTLIEAYAVETGKPAVLRLVLNNQTTQIGQLSSVTWVGGAAFTVVGDVPRPVPQTGTTVDFVFTPPDTGWYSARFRIRTEPCLRDTVITVRLYAISPIITAWAPLWNAACATERLDSVLITNTGNSDLLIPTLTLEPGGAPFALVGTSRGQLPLRVPPRESVWVYLRLTQSASGTATLVIEHNDQTLVRQVARPLRVALAYDAVRPQWQRSPASLDFATLCVGQERILTFELQNTGIATLSATVEAPLPFAPIVSQPVSLTPTARKQIQVRFAPQAPGQWRLPLVIHVQPCDLSDTIVVSGEAQTTDIVLEPQPVRVQMLVGEQVQVPVVVRSRGTATARLAQVQLNPPDTRVRVITPLPLRIPTGSTDTLWLNMTAGAEPGEYVGTLCAEVDSLCPLQQCTEVRVTVLRQELRSIPSTVAFPPQRCIPTQQEQTVVVINAGQTDEQLTSVRVEPADAPFQLALPSQLPLVIKAGEQIALRVEYVPPDEGIHQAMLVLESTTAWQQPQRIPLRGEFARVQSQLVPQQVRLDTVEPCSPVQTIVARFSAEGLLSDTLQLVESPTSAVWRGVTNVRQVIVPAQDSTTIILTFDPAQAAIGIQSGRFRWQSAVCLHELVLDVEGVVMRPRLEYTPLVLDWQRVMQNTARLREIIVNNPTPVARTLESIKVVPLEGGATARVDVALPVTIQPGEQRTLPVELTGTQVGVFRGVLEIVEHSECWDTTTITLHAEVEQEHYWARLAMDMYLARVGEYIHVPVVLTTRDSSDDALWRAEPTAVGFTVQFDPFVLQPVGARVGAEGEELPLDATTSTVTVRIPKEVRSRLGASDTLATLTFLGLQSPPLRSVLHFARSWAQTAKPYTIEHRDGLVVLDACVAWMKVALAGTVTLSIAPVPADETQLPLLHVEAEQNDTLYCTLYGSTGQKLSQWELTLSQGSHTYPFPVALASGIHYLVVETATGMRATLPVVVTR